MTERALTVGVITARGGSKGIPGKNLKPLGGKPLIAYTIEAALDSGAFDRLILSTDDPAIASVARGLGCDVPFMRPPELAADDVPHLPVMQHAVMWLRDHDRCRPDRVMILQPTSPFRRPEHIREAIALLDDTRADSVVSVSPVPSHFHPMRTVRISGDRTATLFASGDPIRRRVNRRQDLPDAWMLNGAIYLFRAGTLFADEPSLYGNRTVAYAMTRADGLSIDDADDWIEAERLLHRLLPAGPHGR